jgi:hypothetical protein
MRFSLSLRKRKASTEISQAEAPLSDATTAQHTRVTEGDWDFLSRPSNSARLPTPSIAKSCGSVSSKDSFELVPTQPLTSKNLAVHDQASPVQRSLKSPSSTTSSDSSLSDMPSNDDGVDVAEEFAKQRGAETELKSRHGPFSSTMTVDAWLARTPKEQINYKEYEDLSFRIFCAWTHDETKDRPFPRPFSSFCMWGFDSTPQGHRKVYAFGLYGNTPFAAIIDRGSGMEENVEWYTKGSLSSIKNWPEEIPDYPPEAYYQWGPYLTVMKSMKLILEEKTAMDEPDAQWFIIRQNVNALDMWRASHLLTFSGGF